MASILDDKKIQILAEKCFFQVANDKTLPSFYREWFN